MTASKPKVKTHLAIYCYAATCCDKPHAGYLRLTMKEATRKQAPAKAERRVQRILGFSAKIMELFIVKGHATTEGR